MSVRPGESMELPRCDFRVEVVTGELFGCRHTSVRAPEHRVSSEVCRSCSMRTVPCATPRTAVDTTRTASGLSWVQASWNAARAVISFARDGFRFVSGAVYETRIAVCRDCDRRVGNRCRECGCRLALKARGRAFRCPLGRWPDSNVTVETRIEVPQ